MRQDNKVLVDIFTEKAKNANTVFITGFAGLKESDISDLRKKLDAKKADHRVIKNRLFKIISGKTGINVESAALKGPSAFTMGGEDAVVVAKVLVDFASDHKELVIKGGILDGRFLSSEDVKALASLPSRQTLLGMVVATIASPLSCMVGVLSANLRNMVNVVQAIKDKKEEETK